MTRKRKPARRPAKETARAATPRRRLATGEESLTAGPEGSGGLGPRTRRQAKIRATFHLPIELVSEARDAVLALSGPPVRLTLSRLGEDAIRRELERLKRQHHAGRPFPHDPKAELRGGRPIGS
jgi:hypothetical protein